MRFIRLPLQQSVLWHFEQKAIAKARLSGRGAQADNFESSFVSSQSQFIISLEIFLNLQKQIGAGEAKPEQRSVCGGICGQDLWPQLPVSHKFQFKQSLVFLFSRFLAGVQARGI